MTVNFAQKRYQQNSHHPKQNEELTRAAASQPNVVALQRYIGNAGVQRLINSPSVHMRAQNTMLHRKGCGCSSCGGGKEEETVSRKFDGHIQRWGEEEEQSESASEGGSWFDEAVNTVGDLTGLNGVGEKVGEVVGGIQNTVNEGIDSVVGAASDAANWVGEQWDNATGGGSANNNMSANENESTGGENEESNWWDNAVETVSDWMSGDEAAEESSNGGSWLDDLTSEVEAFFNEEESNENETDEAGSGIGSCGGTVPVGHGGGSSGGVSVKGLTTANFAAATSASSFKHSNIKDNKDGTFDVTGEETITYSIPTPTVSYKISPQPLSECKQAKVDAFIAGDLGAHETQHVNTYKSTFDGTETFAHTFKGLKASNTAELTAAVQAAEKVLVAEKTTARQGKAQTASDKLDQPPWNKPIPGIDECKD